MNFRFLKKGLSLYWKDVRGERRLRSAYGWFLPWHINHHGNFKRVRCNQVFLTVHPEWQSIEVPRNCPVELPPVMSYKTSQLLDHRSGWWTVAATEHAAKTAAFLLFEAYDNFKLWAIPQVLIDGIRRLPLARVLGNQANADELLRLLLVIESTDFEELPNGWRSRTRRSDGKEFSPGRRGVGADWVYYDPWKRQLIDRTTAEVRSYTRLQMPLDHPIRFDFETAIPAYTWAQVSREGADDADIDSGSDEDEIRHDDNPGPRQSGWSAAVDSSAGSSSYNQDRSLVNRFDAAQHFPSYYSSAGAPSSSISQPLHYQPASAP